MQIQIPIEVLISTSATQEAGIASHLIAGIACGVAWTVYRRKNRLIAALGLLEFFLLLDSVFNWRWIFHGFLMKIAMDRDVYGERSLPQELITVFLAGISLLAVGATVQHYSNRPGLCIAICGGLMSVDFWLMEVISWHKIDEILQHMVGPIMVIALIWIGSSTSIVLGALWDINACPSAKP